MRADHHSRVHSGDDEPLCYRNSEGYTDPTAFFALRSVMKESKPMKETHARKEKQRCIRTWVIKAATEAGYTDIYKTTLLGVGDLEKRMGRKRFGEVLGKFIVKPAGAPTLVPETDSRKLYSDAASDFSE